MSFTPSPISAALAGLVAALAWPLVWARYGGPTGAGGFELVLATLLVIALPAHAFVVGFGRSPMGDGRSIDRALLKRIGAWLAAAAVTTGMRAAWVA